MRDVVALGLRQLHEEALDSTAARCSVNLARQRLHRNLHPTLEVKHSVTGGFCGCGGPGAGVGEEAGQDPLRRRETMATTLGHLEKHWGRRQMTWRPLAPGPSLPR